MNSKVVREEKQQHFINPCKPSQVRERESIYFMAYYNLEYLLRIFDEILQAHSKSAYHNDTLDSLFPSLSSLKQLLEDTLPSGGGYQHIEALETEISDACREAEGIPDMLEQMPSKPDNTTLLTFLDKLIGAMKKFRAVVEKLEETPPTESEPTSTARQAAVVGLDGDMLHLKGRLTSRASKLEMIPIVGMGGIGKTTLARSLYDDPLICSHFHARAWVTVTQDYNLRAMLMDLLRCIVGKLPEQIKKARNDELAHTLYQSLYGKRYLIVVDDIWSSEAWDEIKRFFPNEKHRSRVLLTSRDLNVAKYADSSSEHHQMHLLDDLRSWQLFQHKAFGGEGYYPPSLEEMGRKIVRNCGGLPLAISVIGGLLYESNNSKDLWHQLARDVSSVVAEKDEAFFRIFNLSYSHLPDRLRPYFLYMAVFPEDHEIRVSELVSLWLAEGFLNPSETEDLEETTEEYLKALADRNLLSVRRYKSNGEAKSYNIHDLMRDFCIKKAREEKFLRVIDQEPENNQEGTFDTLHRVSFHPSYQLRDAHDSTEHLSLSHSFMFYGITSPETFSPMFSALRSLRVLDIYRVKFVQFPDQVLQLVNLRFLAISAKDLPCEISQLQNLQTLIAELNPTLGIATIPSELWDIPELRHVRLKNTIILIDNYSNIGTQEKLQTLSYISLDDLIGIGLLAKILNIKKLGIVLISELENLNLTHLHHLETLRCVANPSFDPSGIPRIEFPQSIRKLTLRTFTLSRSLMRAIGSLANLQVLELHQCKFDEGDETDAEWELKEEEFGSLLSLQLYRANLLRWKADDDDDDCGASFPRLKHLVIRNCGELEGIPSSFGDIASLEKIEADESNPTLVASIRLFEAEQRDNGNETLKFFINP